MWQVWNLHFTLLQIAVRTRMFPKVQKKQVGVKVALEEEDAALPKKPI
jgi:hypothetical protein